MYPDIVNEDPTQAWDELEYDDIVAQVAALRERIEALPAEVIDDLLMKMDVGVYDRCGNLLGERGACDRRLELDSGMCPFMYIPRFRNSTQCLFVRIIKGPAELPRYEVELTSPELLDAISSDDGSGSVVVQCHRLLTRRDDAKNELTELKLGQLDRDFLALHCKLYTAVLDCYADSVDQFLNGEIEVPQFLDEDPGPGGDCGDSSDGPDAGGSGGLIH